MWRVLLERARSSRTTDADRKPGKTPVASLSCRCGGDYVLFNRLTGL